MKKALVALLSSTIAAFAQLPDFYQRVDRLVWVVDDIKPVVEGWRKAGFGTVLEMGDGEITEAEYRGKPVSIPVRVAGGMLGETGVHWVQPLGGNNAFTDFLKRHGNGVFSLVHLVPTAQAYDAELARMRSLGVGVLQSGIMTNSNGTIRYAFLDTEKEGKYVLGLLHLPSPERPGPLALPAVGERGPRITQYAFAVRGFGPVSRYWAKLGFPEFTVTQTPLRDLIYRGKPGQFEMQLGWQRHGKVPYEWILSLKGPDVYLEHLEKHGEGVHHIAFQVEDMDAAIARWNSLGFPLSMAGAWGDAGKPGSGRFAYHDTHAIGGIDIELLWNFK